MNLTCPKCGAEAQLVSMNQKVIQSLPDLPHPTGGRDLWEKTETLNCPKCGTFGHITQTWADKR
jgi:hypothetical protein